MSIVAHRDGRTAEWMSIHEAASLVGVSPATLRRWCDAGDIRAFTTPGGHRRFSRRAITGLLPPGPAPATDGQVDRVGAVLLRKMRLASRRIAAEPPWTDALTVADRQGLEQLARQMVAGVVSALRVEPSRRRPVLLPGRDVAMRCGELVARRGVHFDAMVEAGLLLDTLVVHEVAEAAGRLGLSASEAARWLELTADCANRFLADAMRGHTAARAPSGSAAAEGDPP